MGTARPGDHHDGTPGRRRPSRSAAGAWTTPRALDRSSSWNSTVSSERRFRYRARAVRLNCSSNSRGVRVHSIGASTQRRHLGDIRVNKYRTSWRKVSSLLSRVTRPCSRIFFGLCAGMLSCGTACLSVEFSSRKYELPVEMFSARSAGRRTVLPGSRWAPACRRKDSSDRTDPAGSSHPALPPHASPCVDAAQGDVRPREERQRSRRACRSPWVVSEEIDCAYGDFHWGFTWGITLWVRSGILLERHLLRQAKMPVSGPVRGSAGSPDSLVHKPVNTSGRARGLARVRVSPLVHRSSVALVTLPFLFSQTFLHSAFLFSFVLCFALWVRRI